MDRFLPQTNALSERINDQATDLYNRLQGIDVESLPIPYYCKEYFKGSHARRLFFSIETSAHILFRSVTLKTKPIDDLILMDYGAGVGTLYLLAKMCGCKKVIYNDHLEDWKNSAQVIAETIGINIDEYIIGDIEHTLKEINEKKISCDIITSRNVIEHIYKLEQFYHSIYLHQPTVLVFSSTTANYHNPASHLKHILWHKKWEKTYLQQRLELIKNLTPEVDPSEIQRVAKSTRGLAAEDLKQAITTYLQTNILPDPSVYHTNTCDPANGVWAEHLITFEEYKNLINEKYFHISFVPGFWDTHYNSAWKNILSRSLNAVIRSAGRSGIKLAPFIYVIAEGRNTKD